MKKNGSQWLVLGTLLVASTCWGQAEKVPGRVEFHSEQVLGSTVEPNVDVLLEKPMLRVMASASQTSGGAIASLIEQIDSIQVKVWEDLGEEQSGAHLEAVGEFAKDLKEKHWQTMVRVPDEGELVEVLTLTEGEVIKGLLVLVAEEDELVFVNIAGSIEPEVLGATLAPIIGKLSQGEFDLEEVGAMLMGGQVHEEKEVEIRQAGDAQDELEEATPEEK